MCNADRITPSSAWILDCSLRMASCTARGPKVPTKVPNRQALLALPEAHVTIMNKPSTCFVTIRGGRAGINCACGCIDVVVSSYNRDDGCEVQRSVCPQHSSSTAAAAVQRTNACFDPLLQARATQPLPPRAARANRCPSGRIRFTFLLCRLGS